MKFRTQILVLKAVFLIDMILMLILVKNISLENGKVFSVSAGKEYMEPKVVALTFDDGPDRKYTEKLLDGLKERDVKASFFLVGECIAGNEETLKRMEREGHLIGVHCMQHTELTKEPLNEALEQIEKTKEMIAEITGKTPEYIRPPYGSWSAELDEQAAEKLSLTPVFWNVDSLDWKLKDTAKIVNKVLHDTEDGDIILMHDEFSSSVEAALRIIDNLLAKGYTFVTVDELTID